MSIEKEGKPPYEAPVVMPLGELATGEGQPCTTGGSAVMCNKGSTATNNCRNGSNAVQSCRTGTAAGQTCNTGIAGKPPGPPQCRSGTGARRCRMGMTALSN
jgi:hypothetical protein